MKKKKTTKVKAKDYRIPLIYGASSKFTDLVRTPTATGIHAEQAGRFITIHLDSQLCQCVNEAIAQRKQMGFEPKYIEFILPDYILGLKVLH